MSARLTATATTMTAIRKGRDRKITTDEYLAPPTYHRPLAANGDKQYPDIDLATDLNSSIY